LRAGSWLCPSAQLATASAVAIADDAVSPDNGRGSIETAAPANAEPRNPRRDTLDASSSATYILLQIIKTWELHT
jgi:hypothetical protein